VSLFSLATSSGRTLVVTLGLCSGFSVIYVAQNIGEPISFRKYGLPILAGSVVFFAYFVTTTSLLHKWVSYVYLTKVASHLPDALIGLADLTHYLVGGFPAFQSLINSSQEANQCVSLTFGVLSRIMHEIDPSLFGYPDYVQPFVFVPTPTNVYTYLDAFYHDFGWIGIAIFPFLIGLVTTTLYLWMRRSPSIMKVYVVSLMGLCIFQSTGVNTFGTFQTWVWIVFPLGLLKLLALLSRQQRKYKYVHNEDFTKAVRTGALFRHPENKS
jgi:oligosaccharide repeat unit polymerase